MTVKPIPEGYHTVTPYLAVRNAPSLITFLKAAFGAEEVNRTELPDSHALLNAELRIGNSMVMVAEARGDHEPRPSTLYLYVEDTDGAYQRAIQAGATSLMAPSDQFYGDRNAGVEDSSGNQWWIATRIENLSNSEIVHRSTQWHQ